MDVVDHVLEQIVERERKNNINPVQLAALKAQEPYKTVSMKELGPSYEGPPKYLTQRDAPLEIPQEIIRKLFTLMDNDMDDKVSIDELMDYVEQSGVPIPQEIVYQMFREAASKRNVVHQEQYELPLNFEEIQYQVRGRHGYNTGTQSWEVMYRPMRDYWILLLLTVSERLFALQVPKVIPGKIRA